MAIVLLLLLCAFLLKRHGFIPAAIIVHVINMTSPQVFRLPAIAWLGFSHLLGMMVSKIVLSVVFLAVVTPVGLLRRVMGKDAMQLKAFKASEDSVMVERNHTFTGSDLEKPY